MRYIYYMTQRPFGIGCQPMKGLIDAEEFDERTEVAEGVRAWARLYYERRLTDAELRDYELTAKTEY